MNNHQLWFKSNKFEIIEGEDAQTNPLCFGRQLGEWLSKELSEQGYETELIPEDWGWCVMCSRKPFMLWVGCANIHDYATAQPSDPVPLGEDVVWSCIVVAEQSLISRLFKRIDATPSEKTLFKQVHDILSENAKVTFVDEP